MDSGSEVGSRREGNTAGGGGTSIDGRLDGASVVVKAVAGGAEIGDG